MKLRAPLSLLVLLPLVASACNGTDADPDPELPLEPVADAAPPPSIDAAAPDADAAGEAALTWAACDLRSEGGGPAAECASVALPLRAGVADGQTLDVRVKRYRPTGGQGKHQLWMLQGGPGGSAYVFEGIVEQIGARYPDVDFYLPDHRGTGSSSRIGCSAEGNDTEGGFFITPDEWPSCIADVQAELGDRLAAYGTTNAANDLGLLIERARVPGQTVQVYGVSYGTYWATRYMQLFPEQADGVILDSFVPPGGSLARQDEDANEAAHDFFTACAADTLCASKLGADPWAKVNALFAKLKAGHCPAIANPAAPTYLLFRRAFGQFLMHPDYRKMIAPMVYRADRCEPKDIAALAPLLEGMTQEAPVGEMLHQWGWVLSNNVLFSEMWEQPSPTAAELEAIREGAVASRDVTLNMDALIGKWPTYPSDPLVGQWPNRSKPVLVLQGGLDPATLLRKARVAKDVFTKPGQHWIEIPSATHTVIGSSTTTERRSCGTLIMMSFFEHPEAPDTSCLNQLIPLSFEPSAATVSAFFGTTEAWE